MDRTYIDRAPRREESSCDCRSPRRSGGTRINLRRGAAKTRQHGSTAVEFAVVSLLFFTIVFSLIQYAELTKDRAMLTEAAVRGSRVYGAKRRLPTPCGSTRTQVRNILSGTLTNAANVDSSVTMTLTVKRPCSSCTCVNPEVASGGFCVTTCYNAKLSTACNEATCSNIFAPPDTCSPSTNPYCLGPPAGAAAEVRLSYSFTPLFTRIGATNITSLTATISDTLK